MAYLYLARELCITSKTGPCFGFFHCCQSFYASVAVSLASRTNSFQPGIVFLLLVLEFFWPMLALTALVRQEITCMIVFHYECILCTSDILLLNAYFSSIGLILLFILILLYEKVLNCTAFDALPVTPTRYVKVVSMSFIKICGKFIRPTTVLCGTDLLYQTQHEIQITTGSGSMNESLIDTVGCLCSIAVCLCFPLFHNVHICICSV